MKLLTSFNLHLTENSSNQCQGYRQNRAREVKAQTNASLGISKWSKDH